MAKKSWLQPLKQTWRQDLFAGFVVSLVALPLSLGLALASGAPPIAGVITAVVGGLVVAIFGGSYVTITGPGNGLAVATLASVEILGNGNLSEGWPFTMAAIVISGIVIFILGALKFGAISDFFPSTAVEGMLGAIGLIIMARQLHIMLGEVPDAKTTLSYITEMPQTIAEIIHSGQYTLPALGLFCLIIMFLYPLIRYKSFHIIPAPMWVVILSIGFSFYMEFKGNSLWIPADMTIAIPENLFQDYAVPNFSKWKSEAFLEAVIMLTLIATIETLLSIKGIERLDVLKRKAKVNKDLRAHGLATTISGFLGGLNVVTVIARSSVNVNNGALSRYSNLFQGLIIGAVVLLFRDLVVRIPLPALAAILVYTGYKLIAPRNFIELTKLGWESVAIYLLTFAVTILNGIIPGIAIGIAATFILQLLTTQRAGLILRNLFKPNTLLFTESDGTYILSIRRYANFMNYIGIKKQLDSIPSGSKVVVDLTLCDFVDNSVMEHLHGYNEFHEQKGGSVEIIGLDDLVSKSDHPFAPWLPAIGKSGTKKIVLTKRQKSLKAYASQWGFRFLDIPETPILQLYNFNYFNGKSLDYMRNEVIGKVGDFSVKMLDVDFHIGEYVTRETRHATLLMAKLPFKVPEFVLHEEALLDRLAILASFKDIDFDAYPDFSKRFFLKSPTSSATRKFFSPDLIRFFESNKAYHIECRKNRILILDKERFASITEVKMMIDFTTRLLTLFEELYTELD